MSKSNGLGWFAGAAVRGFLAWVSGFVVLVLCFPERPNHMVPEIFIYILVAFENTLLVAIGTLVAWALFQIPFVQRLRRNWIYPTLLWLTGLGIVSANRPIVPSQVSLAPHAYNDFTDIATLLFWIGLTCSLVGCLLLPIGLHRENR